MKDLRGKVAVVTGAAAGIGKALSLRWLAEGMSVVIADWNADELETTCSELSAAGGDVLACVTDVSDPQSMQNLAAKAYARYSRVDLLCNNAGILGPHGDELWKIDQSDWNRVFAVNLHGPLNGFRAFLPAMIASGEEAHIVTTASMASFSATPVVPCYTASKHAILAVCEALRLQLQEGGSKVTTSVLLPGRTNTNLVALERGFADAKSAEKDFDEILRRSGILRAAIEPSETASVVAEAVKRGDFWIFPNEGSRDRIASRIEEALAAAF